MPWFGDPRHIDVGYSSQDPDVIRRQIDEAVSMGISGFVVDWNGPTHTYTDKNFEIMEQIASEKHFQVALLYNESDDPAQSTDETITALDKAYKAYFGPDAPYRSAYITYNNRPIVFIFPKSGKTDWNLVRQHVNNWATPPLLLYKEDSTIRQRAGWLLRLGQSRQERLAGKRQRLGQRPSGRFLQAHEGQISRQNSGRRSMAGVR